MAWNILVLEEGRVAALGRAVGDDEPDVRPSLTEAFINAGGQFSPPVKSHRSDSSPSRVSSSASISGRNIDGTITQCVTFQRFM